MSATILDGKSLALKYQTKIKDYITKYNLEHEITLAVILVGHNPASEIYVKNKKLLVKLWIY
jgi:methylenetetrahydrofolate dehydrogenase (NADP+)/methenyltetrahydrofolate cyclohydrolase